MLLTSLHLEAKPIHLSHGFGGVLGEADPMISLTQLTDVDENGMGKSGLGVAHTYKPREMQPVKSPQPNGKKGL